MSDRLGWNWRLLGPSLIYSRRVKVKLDLAPPTEILFEECRALIVQAMARAPHMWVSHVNGPSLAGWQQRIYGAADLDAIVELIQLGPFRSRVAIPVLADLIRNETTDKDTQWTAVESLGRIVRRRFLNQAQPVQAALEWLDKHERRNG